MYIEHPYSFEGKYYAKVDDQFVEISKEVAYAMNNFYRSSLPRKVDIKDETGEVVECVRREISYSEANDLSGESDFSIETFPDNSIDVEEIVIGDIERKELIQLIDTLSEDEKYIIDSIYYRDELQKYIAAKMNISQQMVAYKLKTALKKLRCRLNESDFNLNFKNI